MQNKVNLEQILKQYLTLETVRANNPDYTFNMIISAMKEACRQTLELASENAEVMTKEYFETTVEECLKGCEIWEDSGNNRPSFIALVDRESIINTIKQVE